jgi:hypothetical protein
MVFMETLEPIPCHTLSLHLANTTQAVGLPSWLARQPVAPRPPLRRDPSLPPRGRLGAGDPAVRLFLLVSRPNPTAEDQEKFELLFLWKDSALNGLKTGS